MISINRHFIRFSAFYLFLLLMLPNLRGEEAASSVTLTQAGTVDTLLAGYYDGWMTIGELRSCGDFGLGTVDRIDGELVLLDGGAYVVRGDKSVDTVSDDETVPFASVVPFDLSKSKTCTIDSPMSASEFSAWIDEIADNPNLPLAIKVTGTFEHVEARSEIGQNPPYKPLAETMKTAERSFSLGNITGDMIGFRTPAFMKGLNVPGYHFHIISSGRTSGGHLTGYRILSGTVSILPIGRFTVILPTGSLKNADLSIDRSSDLRQVERIVE